MPTESAHLKLLDQKKLAYRCSACEREKRLVRALVEHVRKGVADKGFLNIYSTPTEDLVRAVLEEGRAASA